MSLVVSLPAGFAVESGFTFVTCDAYEHFLQHTTLGTVNIFITSAAFVTLRKGFLCAHTSCNRIAYPLVFLSFEPKKKLLDFLRVLVLVVTLFNSSDYLLCEEL